MLFKLFTPLGLACSYFISIRNHGLLLLFSFCLSSKIHSSTMLIYFTLKLLVLLSLCTTPHSQTRGEIKCEVLHCLKSTTTDLPTFMCLLLISSIYKRGTGKDSFQGKPLSSILWRRCILSNLKNSPLLVIPSF